MTTVYIQTAAALVFVILLIIGLSYVMRRRQGADGLMKIVGYQSMGPKKGIAALKIGREILLVGVSASDIRLLKTYGDDELDIPEKSGFQERLHGIMGRTGNGK
jgi:flagellar biogenesis protein FliO